MILSITLLILAAFFKAVADTLQHHYDISVFNKLDGRWWNPEVSWKYVKLILRYRPDAWHLANSLMIVSFICFGLFHESHYKWWIELIAGGVLFNVVFSIFYDRVLKRKSHRGS